MIFMEKIYLNHNYFKKFEIISNKVLDGKVLKQGDYLYKLYDNKVAIKKENLIDILMQLKEFDNCAMPDAKIYLNNKFRGIRMIYYSEYQNLYKILNSNIDMQTRLSLCKKVIMTIKNLYNQGVAYHDIHTDNIIVREDDAKLVDMDGSILLSSCDKEALELINHRIKINTIILVLSCYYKKDFHDIIDLIKKRVIDKNDLLIFFPFDFKSYAEQFYNEENINLGFEFILSFFEDEKVKTLKKFDISYYKYNK